jgi:hypothetical protein
MAKKQRTACNKPRRIKAGEPGAGRKKSVVTACKDGKKKTIMFGDPNMKIKKSQPGRRSNFRARHKCKTAKDKFTARYWSCKAW